jgi:hypothetical protein
MKIEAQRNGKHVEVAVIVDAQTTGYFGLPANSEYRCTVFEARTKLLPMLQQAIRDGEMMMKGVK